MLCLVHHGQPNIITSDLLVWYGNFRTQGIFAHEKSNLTNISNLSSTTKELRTCASLHVDVHFPLSTLFWPVRSRAGVPPGILTLSKTCTYQGRPQKTMSSGTPRGTRTVRPFLPP